MKTFEVTVVVQGARKFVEGAGGVFLETEDDVADFIGLCVSNDVDRVLLHGSMLPKEFFDLKTGVAGMAVQKFVNYQIRVAAVLARDQISGKFNEFVAETNRGRQFRVFFDRQEAVSWLTANWTGDGTWWQF